MFYRVKQYKNKNVPIILVGAVYSYFDVNMCFENTCEFNLFSGSCSFMYILCCCSSSQYGNNTFLAGQNITTKLNIPSSAAYFAYQTCMLHTRKTNPYTYTHKQIRQSNTHAHTKGGRRCQQQNTGAQNKFQIVILNDGILRDWTWSHWSLLQ